MPDVANTQRPSRVKPQPEENKAKVALLMRCSCTLQISEPNEFDIMLVMPIARIQLDECDDTGAYYYLTFKRNPKEKYLNRFLDEDRKLSADKMLTALRKIIKEEVKNIKGKY